jgi:hypothetical protein
VTLSERRDVRACLPHEQLVPIPRLAVLAVLDLQPLRMGRVVAPILPLGDDTLEILRANGGEELATTAGEMLRAENDARALRHDRAKDLLPLDQRQLAEILAVGGGRSWWKATFSSRRWGQRP